MLLLSELAQKVKMLRVLKKMSLEGLSEQNLLNKFINIHRLSLSVLLQSTFCSCFGFNEKAFQMVFLVSVVLVLSFHFIFGSFIYP